MRGRALLPLALLAAAAPVPEPPRLTFPLACALGKDCAIQSYQDDDPGPGVRDYRCGGRTYAGHGGTDIRLTSMAQQRRGVNVLAAAPGVVRGIRDGEPEMSMRRRPAGDIAGKECGNGVVIAHPGGWQTQYCHMARGSIAVRPGQAVATGAVLGRVGLSGDTEFPHLHLSVRHDGDTVDPFAWGAAAGQCRGGRSLWANTPAYAEGHVLVAGFAAGPVTMDAVQEEGAGQVPPPRRDTPLVAFAQAIGLQGGDAQRMVLRAPDGQVLADNRAPPLDRDKAQVILFAGKKAPAGGWPAGTYRSEYQVIRSGRVAIERRDAITL
ncbi:M23 family metallopeptidase [uncultured Sphingomonas sp.]|uniref:M23 family metallopeptidase n=1 Tax=uncultured Sphingomonas sp. TaxID=158754 RepID=UPI0025F07B77|nr:M23 family metallopeptidase [uncultured Sphingomonas sp.]